MRRLRSDFGMASTAITALALACGPAIAAPLDAEACARLKAQRDELHAAGVREAMSQPPPARGTQFPTERAQQIKALIDVDGQLRFRCAMELPIASLRPDPVEEFVDTGDTAGGARPPVAKTPVAKKPKAAAKAAPAAATAPPPAPAAPSAPAAKTPPLKTGANADPAQGSAPAAEAPPKPAAKPRAKVDDAFRAPAAGDTNGTPLDKQVPKPQ